jgi:hypothetical protein
MNNIFKLNNRFAILHDDFSSNISKNKKRNEFENSKYNNKNSKNILKEDKGKIIKEQNLSMEYFPQLLPKVNILESKKMNNSMNFLEKIKTNVVSEKNELDIEYDNLKPGWLLIKQDRLSNKIIHKYKNGKNNEKYLEEDIPNDSLHNLKIINSLIDLHEKRTEEYIQLWGYDEWEKMFRFPNHDYEYFEKLDELLEEELLEEQTEEEENY